MASSELGSAAGQKEIVEFWFDPLCPWAWITSRWMLEVEQVRPVTTRWNVMSLSYLNSGREVSEDYQQLMDSGWAPVRIAIAAAQQAEEEGGDRSAVLGRFYTELGTLFHHEKKPREEATYRQALRAAGLDESLVDAGSSTAYDEALKASHHAGMDQVGMEVGTPVISVAGTAFFGPVVTPAPRGEPAGKLWDGVLLVAQTDGFFELKRSRDREAIFD